MCGQCGIKRINIRDNYNLREKYNEYIKTITNLDYYNNDPDFISETLYYPYKEDIIIYTSIQQFSEEHICPILIPRKSDLDFCGNVVDFDDKKNEYVTFDINGKL